MNFQGGLFDDAPDALPDVDHATAQRKLETAEGCLSAYRSTSARSPLHDQCIEHFTNEVARWKTALARIGAAKA